LNLPGSNEIARAVRRWKPYPTYKNSGVEWIDRIPTHWEVCPLFTIAREKDQRNRGNQMENVLSLSYGKVINRDVTDNFGLLPESFETYQIVLPGDIVLRLTDLQNDKRSLRVGLVREPGIITSAYVSLEMYRDIGPAYGYYLLHGYDVTKVFYGFGAGVRQTMKFEDLKRLPILKPPPSEQRAIAVVLDRETAKSDALVAKKERLIELLQEKRAALITRAVTKGLDPNVPMKDSGVEWLGAIPAHWEMKRLRHVTRINQGLQMAQSARFSEPRAE
jgi:type I restriction enzyme S subunit